MSYDDQIAKGLNEAWARVSPAIIEVDVDSLRWVILSDQHRGGRDGADDFERCEAAYHQALQHYFREGYHLCLLGDVEELWETRLPRPLKAYRNSLELERQFHVANRLVRVFGNHDDQWKEPRQVERHLDSLFPGVCVREGLAFNLRHADQTARVFLVHGHQGTLMSDRFSGLARLFVRYIWGTLQRLNRHRSTQPSEDHELRDKHNRAMYRWAVGQPKLILLTGHTHKPVFLSGQGAAEAEQRLQRKRAGVAEEHDRKRRAAMEDYLHGSELDIAWQRELEQSPEGRRPAYFNTGCCCFSSGSITGLELADGKIRLVRWPETDGTHVRVESDLGQILQQFAG